MHIKQDSSLKIHCKGNENEQKSHFGVCSSEVGDIIGNKVVIQTGWEIGYNSF